MSAKTAFVDSSVLTDATLKNGEARRRAKDMLDLFAKTLLPVYAIKELKAGPLGAYHWLHDKLVVTGSFALTQKWIQRISRTQQRNLTSTALEALAQYHGWVATAFPNYNDLVAKYGGLGTPDQCQRDELRLWLQTQVMRAWQKRRKVASDVVQPLACYAEKAPFIDRGGLLSLEPRLCDETGCCLVPQLERLKGEVQVLRIVCQGRKNLGRYAKALKRVVKGQLDRKSCRRLGDAYYALFAPKGTRVLTTNTKDHRPLAAALRKRVAPLPRLKEEAG